MSNKLQIKQVDLSHVQKDATKIKVLVIDDDGNVFWSDTAGGGTYTNADPITDPLGGIAVGETFDNVSMQDMWTALLYPFYITFGVSGGNPLEVGAPLPATLTFTWNSSVNTGVVANSISISDITGTLLTGLPADGSSPYTYGTPVQLNTTGSYTWNIQGTKTAGGIYTTSASKQWYWRVYWGTSSSTSMPDQTFIKALTNTPIKANRLGQYDFAANDYKYLAIPAEYGIPNTITYNSFAFALADASDGYMGGSGSITYTTVNVTNGNGITEAYNVFRSKNPLVGAVYMLVS